MNNLLTFQLMCEQLPLGLFVVDAGGCIRYWNRWLEQHTGIQPAQAIGKTLMQLHPEHKYARYDFALEQVIHHKAPQVLSQSLNHYLIPIRMPVSARHGLPMMQQQVHIHPLPGEQTDDAAAVVIIQDVTEHVMRLSALAKMTDELRTLSTRDHLTGMYNRHFMREWLSPQLKLVARQKHPLACLMCDIDHFKTLNDTYGHDVGDTVLKQFADIAATQLRASDIMTRFGGEEFVALLPNCNLKNGIMVAERMLNTLRMSALNPLKKGEVSLSIGVAVCHPDDPITGEELLKQADVELYQAKNHGRNRVMPAIKAGTLVDAVLEDNTMRHEDSKRCLKQSDTAQHHDERMRNNNKELA